MLLIKNKNKIIKNNSSVVFFGIIKGQARLVGLHWLMEEALNVKK